MPDVDARRPRSTGLSHADLVTRYERDRLSFLLAAAAEHGPAVELAPGTFLLSDPPAIADVLRRTNSDFLISTDRFRRDVAGHKGDPSTDEWMAGRRAFQRGLTTDLLDRHRDRLAADVDALCDRWLRAGTPVDPLGDLEALCGASFARLAFGDGVAGSVALGARDLLAALAPIVASPVQLPRMLTFLPRFRRAANAERALQQALRDALPRCAPASLAAQIREAGLSDDLIVRVLVAASIAAYRVPAAAILWTLCALGRDGALADECAAALRAAPGQEPDLLTWVRRESLRLWPPTWMLFRQANGEQVCGGWRVPAGAAVMISPHVVHRVVPRFCDRPGDFVPARWRDLRPAPGEYLPFGAGSRWCMGTQFGELEMTAAISGVLARLEIDVPGPAPRPVVRTTMVPGDFTLRVAPRH